MEIKLNLFTTQNIQYKKYMARYDTNMYTIKKKSIITVIIYKYYFLNSVVRMIKIHSNCNIRCPNM